MRVSFLAVLVLLAILPAVAPLGATPARPVPSPSPTARLGEETLSASEAAALRRERDPSKAIPRIMAVQADAWNRGDLSGFMDGYLRSADLTYTAGGVVVEGWKTLFDRYQSRYGSDRSTMGRLRFENLQITTLGADYALCIGQWFLQPPDPSVPPVAAPTPPSGEPPARARLMDGVFSLVWQRTPEGWKILHDHSSARTPR